MSLEEGTIQIIDFVVGRYGFPIFVVWWFMKQWEGMSQKFMDIIAENTEAINKLTVLVDQLCKANGLDVNESDA